MDCGLVCELKILSQNQMKQNFSPCNNTSFEQVGALLDHLAKRTDGDYEKFCKCLKEDNQGHIVTEILEDPSSIRKDIGDSHNAESLSDCSVHLCDKPRLLLNSVETRSRFAPISNRENPIPGEVASNDTPFEQVGALLDHLEKRTDGDYEKFCKCLKEDNQGHIVTEILEDPSSIRKDIGDSHNAESLSDCSVHLCDKPRLLLNEVETSYDAEKLSRTAAVKTPAELEIAHNFNHLEELVLKLAANDVYEQSIRHAKHFLQLLCRNVRFLRSLERSNNRVVRCCFQLVQNGSRSTVSRSFSKLCDVTQKSRHHIVESVCHPTALFKIGNDHEEMAGLVRDLLALRAGLELDQNLSAHDIELLRDINFSIRELCTH
ncbi:hypothetical protein CAPTEDRAFT_215569 [Capitella teleta]|uniref:Uncharacterized protein n=1 Tax=Capitella teleta TaxID=283909 RepID=R7U9G3_CAPTE|nr:hypothetical protein CAPTEDRAFT_215569 [Capitella teleta]|eukprot:ELU02786.1 hypothetical protein CAPTEDRAFT_215569 [Capitella teleta]